MKQYIHQFAAITALLSVLGVTAANAADSTNVLRPHVAPVVQPYLLAQGSILRSTGSIDTPTTSKHCMPGTQPYLETSIIQTQLNSVAAIQGIQNSLQLRAEDYHIVGALYMSNQVLSNSYASANWQIWCQPNHTA